MKIIKIFINNNNIIINRMKLKHLISFTMFLFIGLLCLSSVNAYEFESEDWITNYIRIYDEVTLTEKKQDLENWVWKNGKRDVTPTSITTKTATTILNFGSISTSYISSCQDFYYDDDNYKYHIYYITNKNPNNRLFVFATGHGAGSEVGSVTMVNAMLSEGYDVIIKYLSGMGVNSYKGTSHYNTHETMKNDATTSYNPIESFINELYWTLNYITNQKSYIDISMVGISGGGWNSILYTALDDRITSTYPVAGYYPRFIFDEIMAEGGDWEQGSSYDYVHDFYTNNVSYLDMTIIGASKGRLLAIYNDADACCFWGGHSKLYENYINLTAYSLGGSFKSFITKSTAHQITTEARNLIIATNEEPATNKGNKMFPQIIKININAINSSSIINFRNSKFKYTTTNNNIKFINIVWGL